MHKVFVALSAAVIFLTGCATSTPYVPMDGRYGYANQRIENDRYRVVFYGNSSTPRETVETFLLYRAAELTLENGFDYFIVEERGTDIDRTYMAVGPDPYLYGYYPYGFRRFPYYAYGYRWSYGAEMREQRRFEAHAYIVMSKGTKPEGDSRAFDAREVIDNLDARVRASLRVR